MVRRLRLQIGENPPQRLAHDRPIVSPLPQHRSRVADRPAQDLVYEAVHHGARCLSVGGIPDRGGANAAPFYVKGRASRFGAELVRLSPKVMDGPPGAAAPIWDHRTGLLDPRKRTDQRAATAPYAGAR